MRTTFFLIATLLIFLSPFCKAQDNTKGIFANSYREAINGSDLKAVKKYFSLIYNESSCQLTINGVTSIFKISSYSQKISKGLVEEKFTNEESSTLPAGWFDITIKNKLLRESIVTIVLPNAKEGHFYQIPNAKSFPVVTNKTNKADINSWQAYISQSSSQDGFEKDLTANGKDYETQKKIRDSLIAIRIDSVLSKGDNINVQQIRWIADTVASRIKLEKGETFYKEFKLIIDDEGIITRVIPVGFNEKIVTKYLPRISEIIKSYKLTPYKGSNGKYYRSYKVLYIRLLPEF